MSTGINFIKNIGQLITGGIGIVDGSLVYKDEQGEVRNPKGYKEIYLILSQSGSNAPTLSTEIINEIGEFSISRISEGNYRLTIDGAFLENKVITYAVDSVATGAGGLDGRFIRANRFDDDNISIISRKIEAPAGPEAVDFNDSFSLYIRVQD